MSPSTCNRAVLVSSSTCHEMWTFLSRFEKCGFSRLNCGFSIQVSLFSARSSQKMQGQNVRREAGRCPLSHPVCVQRVRPSTTTDPFTRVLLRKALHAPYRGECATPPHALHRPHRHPCNRHHLWPALAWCASGCVCDIIINGNSDTMCRHFARVVCENCPSACMHTMPPHCTWGRVW